MFYKVISKELRDSAIWGGIVYPIKKWVKAPDNSGLFVFKELEDAEKFIGRFPVGLMVVKCTVNNPRPIDRVCFTSLTWDIKQTIKSFWTALRGDGNVNSLTTCTAPQGSWVCDEVYCHE